MEPVCKVRRTDEFTSLKLPIPCVEGRSRQFDNELQNVVKEKRIGKTKDETQNMQHQLPISKSDEKDKKDKSCKMHQCAQAVKDDGHETNMVQLSENNHDETVKSEVVAPVPDVDLEDYGYLPSGIPTANTESEEKWKEFDKIITGFMMNQKIPGLSLAVKLKNQDFYLQSYGWATADEPVLPHHLFRIASVSKILTALGIMRLFEDGKLKLCNKVFGPKGILNGYLPTLAGDKRLTRVTVCHLLQHSGGWDRDIAGDPCFWKGVDVEMGVCGPVNQHQLITYMMGQKLQFTPGTKYAYSNFGYIVLGRVIEKLSGLSYEDYIRNMLASMNIHNIYLGKTRRSQAYIHEVEYYPTPKEKYVESVFHGEGYVAAPYGGFSVEYGDSDGGWVTTAHELVKIMSSLEENTRLCAVSNKSLKLMLGKPSFNKKVLSWYGFGLDITNWGGGKRSWNHGGHMEGSTSCLARTSQGHIFAVLCNYWPADSDYISLVEYALSKAKICSPGINVFTNSLVDASTSDQIYLIKLQMKLDELKSLEKELKLQQYSIMWLNSYRCKSYLYFNVIWTKQFRYNTHLHMSKVEADICCDNLLKQSFLPIHLESYIYDNSVFYAIVSTKSNIDNNITEEWVIKLNMEGEHFQCYLEDCKKQGFVPVNVSTCVFDSNLFISSLLYKIETPEKFWFEKELDENKYATLFNQHARWGHLLTYVATYRVNSKVKFTAIWSDSGSYMYSSEHNMSKYKLLVDFPFHVKKKFVPKVICGYEGEESCGHFYVAVYTKYVKSCGK